MMEDKEALNNNEMRSRKRATENDKPSRVGRVLYGSVDGGWAWLIMIALAFWNILIAGTLKSFGVIYLEYLDLYQRGPVATAWMGFSFSIVITVLAPFSGYLGDNLSLKVQRRLVMCLGVVMATAIAVTGWVPTLEGAIVSYGAAGFAASLVDTPILSLLGKYFKRRRFLASGVVFAGSSLGTLVLPPIFTLLVDTYAIRGAMVVFGGVWLNVLVVGAVIRPLRQSDVMTTVSATTTATTPAAAAAAAARTTTTTETGRLENLKATSMQDIQITEKHEISPRTVDVVSRRLCGSDDDIHLETKGSTLSLGLLPVGVNTFMYGSRQSVDRLFAGRRTPHQSKSFPSLPLAVTADDEEAVSDDDVRTTSTDGGRWREETVRATGYGEETNLCDDCKPEALSFGKKTCQVVSAYWTFLRTPGLPLLIFTFCAASFAYFNQFFIFPPLAREYGMTKMQGAMLLSVSNITELISRLVVGLLVDKGKVNKSSLVQISFALSAVLAMVASFFSNHAFVFAYSGAFGLLGGVFVPLAIPLMVELVPSSQISSAAGIYVLVTGTGISLGPPVLGGVKALTGTFADSLRVCSVFYLVALGFYVMRQGTLSTCNRYGKTTKADSNVIIEVDVP